MGKIVDWGVTVLEVTELPDLPVYSTARAERMSKSGPVGGHGEVYRRPPATPVAFGTPGIALRTGAIARRAQSRMAGKSTISRIERCPVIRRTNRSIPIPMPPVGGIPCSSAWTKTSS
jgi:hypothetical protein